MDTKKPNSNKVSLLIENYLNTILFVVISIVVVVWLLTINGYWFMEDAFHPVYKIEKTGELGKLSYEIKTMKVLKPSTCVYQLEVIYKGQSRIEYVTLEEIPSMKCKMVNSITSELNAWKQAKELTQKPCN
jgi:hypothetical protein